MAQHQTMRPLTELEHQQPGASFVRPTFRPRDTHATSSSPSHRPRSIDVSQGAMIPGVALQEGQGDQYREPHPRSQTIIPVALGSIHLSPGTCPLPGSRSSSTATLPRPCDVEITSVIQSLPRSTGSTSSSSLAPATIMEVPTVFESATTGGYPPTLPTPVIQTADTSANLHNIRRNIGLSVSAGGRS